MFKFDLSTPDGQCDCYLTQPGKSGKYPAVLFYMDGFGPREYLFQMMQKLSDEGFLVLMPNLLYRVKRAPVISTPFPLKKEQMPEVMTELMPLLRGYNPEDGVRDAAVFLQYLTKHENFAGPKIGITGYCMGGGLALRTAAQFPEKIAVAASFHAGRLATDAANSPHLLAQKIKAKIYIAHADSDPSMPPEEMERLKNAFENEKVDFKAELYAGALHGFTMADLPAYNEAALARHWNNLLPLLKGNL